MAHLGSLNAHMAAAGRRLCKTSYIILCCIFYYIVLYIIDFIILFIGLRLCRRPPGRVWEGRNVEKAVFSLGFHCFRMDLEGCVGCGGADSEAVRRSQKESEAVV